jgi:hypothetical protein
MRRYPESLD